MNLCDSDHPEVCYDGRKCPICELLDEKDARITELEEKVTELKNELDEHRCDSRGIMGEPQ
jgi:hypothetical protein